MKFATQAEVKELEERIERLEALNPELESAFTEPGSDDENLDEDPEKDADTEL